MDTSKIVGEKIKSLRESQSISMEELAQRSGARHRTNRTHRKQYRPAFIGSAHQK